MKPVWVAESGTRLIANATTNMIVASIIKNSTRHTINAFRVVARRFVWNGKYLRRRKIVKRGARINNYDYKT